MLVNIFAKLLVSLPLSITHRLGTLLGFLFYLFDSKGKEIATQNLSQSNLFDDMKALKRCMMLSYIELGKGMFESIALWAMPHQKSITLVKQVSGEHYLRQAHQQGKSIIFLTPHLGCFEITSLYIGLNYPITVLYRPPKKKFMTTMMARGRAKGKVSLAAANVQGVRTLLQTLKRKEFIGILPDQIPAEGEGEWAPFFGKPAYTMTLASKLAEKTQAVPLMVFGERLAKGAGFHIHFIPIGSIDTASLMNTAITKTIALYPTQYLWRYPRYKVRRGANSQTDASV